MHCIDLPAASTVRLSVTARAGAGLHRWDIRVFTAGGAAFQATPRLAYGSRIGGPDREQRIEVPPQDADCRLEVFSHHAVPGGWRDDEGAAGPDTPGVIAIGFCDPAAAGALWDDVLLSFAFSPAAADATAAKPGDGG
ncbi:MAG: hypothetical protein ACRDQZ_13765 [Mycobacteriales bacterium]